MRHCYAENVAKIVVI